MLVAGRVSNLALRNVGNVQHRLHGQQMQLAQELLLLLGKTKTACRHSLGQTSHNLFHNSLLQLNLLIAGLCQLHQTLLTLFNRFHICQAQLSVDDFNIAQRVNAALNVGDVAILKAAYNLSYSVHLADVGQELVAQAFALACALNQTGNIHKAHSCRNNFFGFEHLAQYVQTLVRNIYNANVWLNGAERIVGSLSASLSNCIKQGTFAYVRQANNTNF